MSYNKSKTLKMKSIHIRSDLRSGDSCANCERYCDIFHKDKKGKDNFLCKANCYPYCLF